MSDNKILEDVLNIIAKQRNDALNGLAQATALAIKLEGEVAELKKQEKGKK